MEYTDTTEEILSVVKGALAPSISPAEAQNYFHEIVARLRALERLRKEWVQLNSKEYQDQIGEGWRDFMIQAFEREFSSFEERWRRARARGET